MKTKIMSLLASAALVLPAASLAADVPQRGTPQSQVRAQHGAPLSSKGPVGTPAITRWNYDGFTVYFENGITLHTVQDRPASQAPAIVSGPQTVDSLPPIEETQTAPAPAPAAQQPATQQAPAADSGELTFDPVSGRFVPAGAAGQTDTAEPKPEETPAPAKSAPEAAPVAPEAKAAAPTAPVAESKPTPAPTPKAEPKPEPAPTPAPSEPATASPDEGEFRFDPVTGRIIIAGEASSEQATAKALDSEQKATEATGAAKQSAKDAAESTQADTEQAAQDTSAQAEAAKPADDAGAADDSGFYIDWGARQ